MSRYFGMSFLFLLRFLALSSVRTGQTIQFKMTFNKTSAFLDKVEQSRFLLICQMRSAPSISHFIRFFLAIPVNLLLFSTAGILTLVGGELHFTLAVVRFSLKISTACGHVCSV